jgi:hypothetical protein
MPLGEIQKHWRVAARGHDTGGLRIGREPMSLQILAAPDDHHAVLPVHAVCGATVRIDRSRRAICLFEPMPGSPAVFAIAHGAHNGRANDLKGCLTALATGEAPLLAFYHLCYLPHNRLQD